MLEFTRKQEHLDANEPYLNESVPRWNAPRENSFVPIPSWEQHLDLLTHLSRYSRVLLAVIGEEGVGKSTLLEQMREQAKEIGQVYSLAIPSQFDLQQLSHVLLQAFNVAPTSASADPLQALFEQLEQLQMRANPSILLLDDAHLISLETLAGILSLIDQASEQLVGLHIVLFGTQRLLKQLDHLGQQYALADLVHVVTLEPLSLAETENYLHQYFELRNFAGPLPLSQERINQLFEESRGLPAKISLLAADEYEHAISDSNQVSEMALVPHVKKLIGAGVLGIGIIILLLSQKQISQWFSVSHTDKNNQPAVMTIEAHPKSINHPMMVSSAIESPSHPIEAQELTSSAPSPQATAPIEFAQPVSPSASTTTEIRPSTPILSNSMPAVKPASLPVLKQEPPKAKLSVSKENVSQHAAQPTPPKAATTKPIAQIEAKSSPVVPKIQPSADQGQFSLQLSSMGSYERAQAFIAENKLTGTVRIIPQRNGDTMRYLVLYGQYPSREAAQAAQKALNVTHANLQAWVRRGG